MERDRQRSTWKEADKKTHMDMTRDTISETGEHKTGQMNLDRQTQSKQLDKQTEKTNRHGERHLRERQTQRYMYRG